jgi:hypothetical protein
VNFKISYSDYQYLLPEISVHSAWRNAFGGFQANAHHPVWLKEVHAGHAEREFGGSSESCEAGRPKDILPALPGFSVGAVGSQAFSRQ